MHTLLCATAILRKVREFECVVVNEGVVGVEDCVRSKPVVFKLIVFPARDHLPGRMHGGVGGRGPQVGSPCWVTDKDEREALRDSPSSWPCSVIMVVLIVVPFLPLPIAWPDWSQPPQFPSSSLF
jgi:hypothetical protein